MKILVAEYAVAVGLGGTFQIEGKAMLSTLVSSFEKSFCDVVYPTAGPTIGAGDPIFIDGKRELEDLIGSIDVDYGLVIAPDDLLAHFTQVLEGNTINLGSSPEVAGLCADKLECTKALATGNVPVVEALLQPLPACGCDLYVIKPRFGCGSEGVQISSSPKVAEGYIATRYTDGLHLSISLIAGESSVLPLTINRQLIRMDGESICYTGSQVPYRTPRASEILNVAETSARVLGLKGYAGIDMIVADRPRVVDVNARPTTSMIGIARVMREELGDLILRAHFGNLPEKVTIEGVCTFTKDDLLRGHLVV
jgi:hypothetical protein